MLAKQLFVQPVRSQANNVKRIYSKFAKYDLVSIKEVNNNGLLALNRPAVLNAFNIDMIGQISDVINSWKDSKSLIVIRGADKVFCAGGDVKTIALTDSMYGVELGRIEYTLNHTIRNLKIPYIALIDGITFGGGVGFVVHGKYRIATERTVFAMPETKIGFFPDIGSSYFLPRMQGKLGYYLGLTGSLLKGPDVLYAGIATHYCESSKILDLECALLHTKNADEVETVINKFCPKIPLPFSLANHSEQINECFNASSVVEILDKLEKDGSEWAKKTTKALRSASPISVNVAFHQLNAGANMPLGKCLQMEYRLMYHFFHGSDFHEGIRALLITKDRNPKWNPPHIEDVSDEKVLSYFQPLPSGDELPINEKLEAQDLSQVACSRPVYPEKNHSECNC